MSLPDHFYQLKPDARIFFVKDEPFNRRRDEDLRNGVDGILQQYPLGIDSEILLRAIQERIDVGISFNTAPQDIYHPIPEQGGDKLAHLFQGLNKKQYHTGHPEDVSPDQIGKAYTEATILAGKITAQYLRSAGLEDRAKPLENYFSNLALFGRN